MHLSFYPMSVFLIARNWNIVLISASRCENIFRPIGSPIINTKRRLIIIWFAILLSSVITSGISYTLTSLKYYLLSQMLHIVAQALVPLLLALVFFGASVIQLCFHYKKMNLCNETSTMNNNIYTSGMKTFLILLSCFLIFEGFLAIVGGIVLANAPTISVDLKHAYHVAAIFVTLDSVCNFLVYSIANKSFRKMLFKIAKSKIFLLEIHRILKEAHIEYIGISKKAVIIGIKSIFRMIIII